MIRTMFSAGVIGLVLAASLAAPARAEACKLAQIAQLEITTLSDGRFSVPLTIEGQELSMMVDTGTPFSVISAAAIQRLKLSRKYIGDEATLTGLGGRKIDEAVTVQSFALGQLQGGRFSLAALPADFELDGVDGLIGLDLLLNADAEFDFAKGKLNYFSKDHCRGEVVHWTSEAYATVPFRRETGKHIEFEAKLDGRSVRVMIDTGASRSIMSLELAQRLFGWTDKTVLKKAEGFDGLSYPFERLSFEGIEVRNPNILLVPNEQAGHAFPYVILGTTILRNLHLYVAVGEKKLYITPASAH